MKIKVEKEIPDNSMESNFLQSEKWAKFKKKEGWNYYFLHFYKDNKLSGYTLLLEKQEGIFKIHYIPRGPILTNIGDLPEVLPLIENFSKESKASFLKIEPEFEYSDSTLSYFKDYKISHKSYQPIDTAIIYLKEDLMKNIPSKKRGRVRNKHNLIFRETNNIDSFYELYSNTFRNKNFKGRGLEYFKDMREYFKDSMKIFEIIQKNNVISSSVNIFYKDTVTYLYSGSNTTFNNLYPGYVLVYSTALFAKEQGFKYFDLWGISDNNKKWIGFSEFKFNLGGKTKKFAGSFDYPINNILYSLYKRFG